MFYFALNTLVFINNYLKKHKKSKNQIEQSKSNDYL